MAVHAERLLHSLAQTGFRRSMLAALTGCFALLVVGIGVLGLLGASWPRRMFESWINIHALFGLLLCGLVLVRCRWCVQYTPPMLPAEVRQLSRHLSRIVYFLLYAVIAVREIIAILTSVWHGGGIDFNLFDQRFRTGPDYPGFNPTDDFQLYLASGLMALIFVRVLALRLWLRSVERCALLKSATEGIDSRPPKESRENTDP